MNLPTILLLLLLAAAVILALHRVRKGGTCSCGDCPGHCSGCNGRKVR